MNMKTIVVAFAVCAFGVAGAADSAPNGSRKLTKQERVMQRTGGMVEDRASAKGKVVFVNAQQKVSAAEVEATAKAIENYTRCIFTVTNKDTVSVDAMDALKAEVGGNAVVALVDSPTLPSVLFAPENAWGVVNVAKLAADAPAADVLAKRVMREMWRSFGYVCGSSDSTMVCVMGPVSSLADLDALKANNISPETMMRVEDHLRAIGVTQFRRATYRVACQEGWAPAPANDFQKAIKEAVHNEKERGPANALKIVPPNQK